MSRNRSRSLALAAALALAAGGAHAYEEYSRREVMSCTGCHLSTSDFTLTVRGQEYLANNYSFPDSGGPDEPVPDEPTGPSPEALEAAASRDPRSVKPVQRLMVQAQDALRVTSQAVARGKYRAGVEGARTLRNVATRIEGIYRGEKRALADQARTMRQQAFRLERTLRHGGRKRVAVAPIQLGQVIGACLACHAAEGLSEEDFRLSGPTEPRSGDPSRPPVPRRARDSSGTRR